MLIKDKEKESIDFVEQSELSPKRSTQDPPKQTSRDTLSYLKAKRINRHKHVDTINSKKFKSD